MCALWGGIFDPPLFKNCGIKIRVWPSGLGQNKKRIRPHPPHQEKADQVISDQSRHPPPQSCGCGTCDRATASFFDPKKDHDCRDGARCDRRQWQRQASRFLRTRSTADAAADKPPSLFATCSHSHGRRTSRAGHQWLCESQQDVASKSRDHRAPVRGSQVRGRGEGRTLAFEITS